MINIEAYLNALIRELKQTFGKDLCYVGLQGSYLRGEATESSDIDVMVVLETVTPAYMEQYRTILQSLGEYDRACGFLCGRAELANWNPLEIWQLAHGTKDFYGTLAELLPPFTVEDHRTYVKMSLNNLYHELCHRCIHGNQENTAAALPGMYKQAFFILQGLWLLRTGEFRASKQQLLEVLSDPDHGVLERCMALAEGCPPEPELDYTRLFFWCQRRCIDV